MGHGSGFSPPVALSWDWNEGNLCYLKCDDAAQLKIQYLNEFKITMSTQMHYLLQICEVQKLAELLLELRLGHCLIVQELDSVLLHLETRMTPGKSFQHCLRRISCIHELYPIS